MKRQFYRNSNFKEDTYFRQPRFRQQLNEAKASGYRTFVNEVRKINNLKNARDLKGDVYIKDIFIRYWEPFKEKYLARLQRPGLIKAVESMTGCHNFSNGYIYYECPNCDNFHMVGFSCHSRFCPSCGKKYKDQRTIKVSEKCLEVPHRQFVFTIPFQLREYFQLHRELLGVLFSTVKETLNSVLEKNAPRACRREKRRLGFVSFLHTFGRDMKWHPHIHVLLAERYLNNRGELKKLDYFPFDYIRITFQNKLFHNIYAFYRDVIKDRRQTQEIYLLCRKLKSKYKDGYYVYGRKFSGDRTTTRDIKDITNYIARYASHPPISERRITGMDTEANLVTWFYDPHEDDDVEDEEEKIGRQTITEDVFEFMKRMIIHIPSKGFQVIRYYGFYSNKFKEKVTDRRLFSSAQLAQMKDNTLWANNLMGSYGYSPLLCHCGAEMEVNYELSYYPRGPTNET